MLCAAGGEARAELSGGMFDMRYVGHAEGLGSERIYSIAEDKYGAIWIATKAGVDRYNCQTVKNYHLQDDFYNGDMGWRRIGLMYDE
jgi:ligand-binding sensor domain-containing protein